jgi:hypothetical protein
MFKNFKRWHLYLVLVVVALSAVYLFYSLSAGGSSGVKTAVKKDAKAVKASVPSRQKPERKPIYGLYLTSNSAASATKVDSVLAAIKGSQINAVVIDIKDSVGYLSYDSQLPLVNQLGLKKVNIKDLPGVLKKFHDHGIYTIARIAVFEDSVLSVKKPEWAVQNKDTGGIWKDNKGLSWLDPANPEVWAYHVDVAKEAIALGFDEINLDYIRFPSDGKLSTMKFPKWAGQGPKSDVIRNFFAYFRKATKDEPAYLSADVFGMVTTARNDLNIGQLLENFAPYVDYICPMVYPSHYASGYLKFSSPAAHPYEVIFNDVSYADHRLASSTATSTALSTAIGAKYSAQIRPWIQDFNLGAVYDAAMIKKEIKAVSDSGNRGWTTWNAANRYTWEAYK